MTSTLNSPLWESQLSPSQPLSQAARPRLMSRALALRCVSIIGASISFYLLLSVVPLYASASGGGSSSTGLTTGALMATTVFGELLTSRLVNRFGYRPVLIVGLILLGAPAMVLTVSTAMPWILAICLIRGLGFAITVVAGGALTASLIPAARRGEGLALVGVVSGVPSLAALPLGVWLVDQVGYTAVAITAGVAALAAVATIPGLPEREPSSERAVGVAAGLRTGALTRPAVVFCATALAAGVIVTFLPLALSSAPTGLVTCALFVQPATATAARWIAGRYGDSHGPARLILPGLLASVGGVFLLAFTQSPIAVISGAALFGIGFGFAQNATLTVMYARVPTAGYGTVSALWNAAYDAGMGIGALAFGVIAGVTGYPLAFILTAALILVAIVPALRDRHPSKKDQVATA